MRLRFRTGITACIAASMMMSVLLTGCGNTAADKATDKPEVSEKPVAVTKEDSTAKPTTETTAEPSENRDASQMSLKDAYADNFPIGVAVNSWQLSDSDTMKLICKDYSSITTENEMKPDYMIDRNATMESDDGMPVINTETLDGIMKMAEDAGLKMRGHTLIWHNQTPDWLFYEGYDTEKSKAGRKTMLKRMESYIKQVITYCQDKHPGVIYAWDVVNEACNDDGTYRSDSPWYESVGEDYIEKAFEYARKYADDDVKLFYNDYNCTTDAKRKLIYQIVNSLNEKGIIDGIGMQSHYDMKYFAPAGLERTLTIFSQIKGIEIQLTEMDMHNNDNSAESMQKEADNYKQTFEILKRMDTSGEANITGVTFWGLNDGSTWLTGFKGEESYPLLFDADNKAKPSYFSVFDAASSVE